MPVMLGLQPTARIAERVAAYRQVRAALGRSPHEIDCEVAGFRVLRRVALAGTDSEAMADARRALAWEDRTARRVHGEGGGTPEVAGGCIGTPETVIGELLALRVLGIRHVIAWVNFGDMPAAKVRRSMELLAQEVLPVLGAMSAAA